MAASAWTAGSSKTPVANLLKLQSTDVWVEEFLAELLSMNFCVWVALLWWKRHRSLVATCVALCLAPTQRTWVAAYIYI